MQGGSEGQEGQVDRETKIRQHLRRKGSQRSSQHRHQSIAQRAPEFERSPGDYARGMGMSGLLLNARIQVYPTWPVVSGGCAAIRSAADAAPASTYGPSGNRNVHSESAVPAFAVSRRPSPSAY